MADKDKTQGSKPRRSWQAIATSAVLYREQTLAQIKPPLPDLPTNSAGELPSYVMDIPRQVLTATEVHITEMLPEELLVELAKKELTAVEVTTAFLRRAGVAQGLTNCLTELLGERALARAEFLDTYLSEKGHTIGPLHGLPISVKEHISMKDLKVNAGYLSLWDNIADEDTHCLQILEKAGAVFHARTTQPQTVMHLETRNNFFGTTVNPYQKALTAGGSSGGEGALVSLRGSCLGIGSDIGGSVRSPAANCGIYGLRPTSARLPVRGWMGPLAGTDNIIPVIGPLSTSIEGIKMFMQTLIDAKPWLEEPSLLPIPWKFELTERKWLDKLRVGVLWHDEVVQPHPPVTRALKEVVAKLKTVPGVEVVDWKPYNHEVAWSIAASLYFVDGAKEEEDLIADSGEPWLPLTKHIIRDNEYCRRLTIEELWTWQNKREVYREEYAKLWNETATGFNGEGIVDVLLCPVGPSAAPVLETAKWWGYTSQWNVLDYPAIVFPVTKCDAKVDLKDKDYQPRSSKDEYNWNTYDPELYDGVPVSLQLVCRRYEDEKLLGILSHMHKVLGLPFAAFP